MKKYEIEYRLHYSQFSYDMITRVFEGKNQTEAIKNFSKQTGCPKSRIANIELI